MNIRKDTNNLIVLSGCSGGGKSALLDELARRGYATVEEPGRRIVGQEMQSKGTALPWVDMEAFARRAVAMALDDRDNAPERDWVFFDRGMIDAASALHHVCGDSFLHQLKHLHRYNPLVFLTPPWPEIYVTDGERQHDFVAAVDEYERLLRDYADLDYEVIVLPKLSVSARADFVLNRLG
ncbi:AAA family ATPase [Agrobacterium rosae]|uniref:AAA family ATPase n=1 Tax=Agrobacterium rosae TaxID=1972867 RepID=UPI0031B81E0A